MMPDEHVPQHHLRVIRALQSGPRAPDRLQLRIEAMQAETMRHTRRLSGRARPHSRFRLALTAAGVAAVLIVALAVTLSAGRPTVVHAAELSLKPAEEAPPAVSPQHPALLQRSFAGVTFPAWSDEFGWRVVGARSDELDRRETETVFYRHAHHRIGYTVISGQAIKPPEDAERLRVRGVTLHRFRLGRQDVVTFERNGRTCVLSGDVHDPDTLVKLATWKSLGAISF